MDWVQGIGLSDLALDFFQKLSSAVNLLATPKEYLLQVRKYSSSTLDVFICFFSSIQYFCVTVEIL